MAKGKIPPQLVPFIKKKKSGSGSSGSSTGMKPAVKKSGGKKK